MNKQNIDYITKKIIIKKEDDMFVNLQVHLDDEEKQRLSIRKQENYITDLPNKNQYKITNEKDMENNLITFLLENLDCIDDDKYLLAHSISIAQKTRRATANTIIINENVECKEHIIKLVNDFYMNIVYNNIMPIDEIIFGYCGKNDIIDSGIMLIECSNSYYISFIPKKDGMNEGKDYFSRVKVKKENLVYSKV